MGIVDLLKKLKNLTNELFNELTKIEVQKKQLEINSRKQWKNLYLDHEERMHNMREAAENIRQQVRQQADDLKKRWDEDRNKLLNSHVESDEPSELKEQLYKYSGFHLNEVRDVSL